MAVDIMAAAMEVAMAATAGMAACLQAGFHPNLHLHLRLCQAWRVRHAALPTRRVRVFATNAVDP
ncbi:hypothetical protein D9M73_91290 [compost metagenome]